MDGIVGEMKYKIGDKVKIRSDLSAGMFCGTSIFTKEMERLKNKVLTIENYSEINYTYKLKEFSAYCWTDDMLESIEKKFTPADLETGMFGITNKKRKFLVLNNNLVFQDGTVWAIDFLNIYFEYTDEMESVERIYNNMLGFNSLDPDNEWCFKCIYKREKPKRTLSQIKEELGYDFDLIEE